MNLKECYDKMEGDYEGIVSRLRKEELIAKMLRKFAADDTMINLSNTLAEKDYKDAFLFAHNMKGMCANLGINKLRASASDLTECLRSGTPTCDPEPLLAKVKEDYNMTIATIAELEI